ncbi:nicotinamide riboside transporter PnuC [Alteromonadaceae bacterium M269]|nr:nicotinamide riboside transporter PnuC [Alteromonadaceae bacterium M269]
MQTDNAQSWLELFQQQWAAQSGWEIIAVVLALAYVWLAARQSIWCWPCALVSTGIYTWIFWQVTLPFQAVLNAYYLLMAVYGWYQWNKHKGRDDEIVIQTWSVKKHILSLAGLAVSAFVLVMFFSGLFDSNNLILDIVVTVFSVFTTLLVAHKVLENWVYWIFINTAAAFLFFNNQLILTSILYAIYVVMAVYGYYQWRLLYQQQSHA